MEDVFVNEGCLVEAGGNKRLVLSGAEDVYWVYSGKIDLFAVGTEGGEHAGARTHLLRAEAGEALFGINGGAHRKKFSFLAVGAPGGRLFRLPFSRFKELATVPSRAESIERLIHLWVSGLSTGVRKSPPPRVFTELKAGCDIILEEGRSARPASGTIWVRGLDGRFRFMDLGNLPGENEDTGSFFPVSCRAWIQAAGETRLQATDTAGCLRKDPSFSGLDRFHRLMVDSITRNIEETNALERRRLQAKAAGDRTLLENALLRLGGILNPTEAAPVCENGGASSLFTACMLVGERLGISFKAPSREASASRGPLDAITRASGVRARKVVLTGKWHRCDHGPLLAFTAGQDSKPIALIPVSAGSYVLHDPSDGTRTKVTAETAASLDPFAFTFYRPFEDHALKMWDILKFGLAGCAGDMWTILGTALIGAVLGLFTPIATGIIISSVIPDAARGSLGQITLLLLTCAIASSLFDITKAVAMLRIEGKMDASVQSAVMDRLLSLPAPFFRSFSAGDLAERTLGINLMRQIVSGVMATTVLAGVFSSFNFILLFYYDWKLALVASLVIAPCVGCSCLLSYLNVRHQRKLSTIQGEISGLVLQLITGISKLRLSGAEDRAFAVWAGEFAAQKQTAFSSRIIQGIQTTVNTSFPLLALMVIFGWLSLGSGKLIGAGDFSAFNSAYAGFQNALLQMFAALMAILNIVPLMERAAPILETLPETDRSKASPGVLKGDIEVGHVNFRYTSSGPLILRDIYLQAHPGEFIALVGPSGSGKSTLLRLLLGFDTPESGALYFDGQDLSTLDVREVRRQTGTVIQSGKIMAGDIFENIVGASNLTIDDAWEAARMAGLEDDIRQMPMGMHTLMAPGGSTLSGGQRQRLMIARAIALKPRILLFDEATSSLDNRTQEIVSKSLEKLQATRIIIAHRLNTIVNADRIYVFDRGRIVQTGTYEELLQQEGVFAELAKRQIV